MRGVEPTLVHWVFSIPSSDRLSLKDWVEDILAVLRVVIRREEIGISRTIRILV